MLVINPTLAIFMTDISVRMIAVQFPDSENHFAYKTLDQTIEVGDAVVVELPKGRRKASGQPPFLVVPVVATDIEFNYGSNHNFGWVVGKVDTAYIEGLMQQEAKIMKVAQKASQEAQRRAFRDELTAMLGPDGINALTQFTIELKKEEPHE